MKKSDIDFSYFIGQLVTEVNTEVDLPLGMGFDQGGLIVECPWRIRREKEIIIGASDCVHAPNKYSHKNVKQLLLEKKITDISFYEEFSLLVIEFDESIFLDLFHESNYFEGWQLNGYEGFDLISLPGGF
ncbi:hypothetical protein [Gracilibacillus sp. YIM 98692]|uniref:hypothetical protein n=1 Tax=Gracilibacillus sp. YIM 98692 TaxID=2663532 RepID=UPI001F09D739|nr:hypothetical protein [Gracilibacillus sp. YIM 98692]